MSAGSRPWPGGVAASEAAATAFSGGPPRAWRLDTARIIASATAPAARRRENETERRLNMFQLLPILAAELLVPAKAANHTVKKLTSDLRSRREESPERKRGRSLAPREAEREEGTRRAAPAAGPERAEPT